LHRASSFSRYGYDPESKSCQQFVYGGCLGNNNRFSSRDECEAVCAEDSEITLYLTDKCEQPVKEGPCAGNFSRCVY
jgi:hypothetical protein